MKPLAIFRMVIAIGALASLPASAWDPLRAHPQNPYILEFRGQATVLRTYGEMQEPRPV